MPELAIATDDYSRTTGNPVHIPLYNMMLEESPLAPSGFMRLSRHGLVTRTTVGAGAVRGLFARSGVFNHDLFTVSGTSVYRAAASLGTIAGTGSVGFAASPTELVLTAGTTAYSYNGTNLAAITFPDSRPVVAVAFLNGLFVYLTPTGRFYWSATLDGRTVDGADFANAESAADGGVDLYVVQDGLWFMGAETVEFWQYTGDADAPFARVEGRLFKRGIKATGCAAELDNGLFWWGDDDAIYRAAEVPQRISTRSVEEKLEGSAIKGCFSFHHQGHPLFAVRTDSGTWVFDVSNGRWYKWGTYGRTNWRVQCAARDSAGLVLGDDTNGAVWEFDETNWDDGSVLERRFGGFYPILGGASVVGKLGVVANPGQTPVLVGQGSDPVLELRASHDGQRWGPYRAAKLGAQGRYRMRVEKRVWGVFDAPGGWFEGRVTDPVPLAIQSAYVNEPGGGRGRG